MLIQPWRSITITSYNSYLLYKVLEFIKQCKIPILLDHFCECGQTRTVGFVLLVVWLPSVTFQTSPEKKLTTQKKKTSKEHRKKKNTKKKKRQYSLGEVELLLQRRSVLCILLLFWFPTIQNYHQKETILSFFSLTIRIEIRLENERKKIELEILKYSNQYNHVFPSQKSVYSVSLCLKIWLCTTDRLIVTRLLQLE